MASSSTLRPHHAGTTTRMARASASIRPPSIARTMASPPLSTTSHLPSSKQPHPRDQCRRRRRHVAAAAAARDNSTTPTTATSLIPDTLREMAAEGQETRALRELAATDRGRAQLAREERAARRRSLASAGLPPFSSALAAAGLPPLTRGRASILQLNVGLRCNQACTHCHVESSPLRTEEMSREVADRCLELLRRAAAASNATASAPLTLDLTGGAPELSSQFRPLVRAATAMGVTVIDRCNLTVLTEPGQEDLASFLAQHRVRVVASLPCYGESNVDAQRGKGVFERSIQGLRMLNAVGYGASGRTKPVDGGPAADGVAPPPPSAAPPHDNTPHPHPPPLQLDLVYNPGGAFLAPSSSSLEPAYRRELREAHNVEFDSLLCLNNLPVKRFADWLQRSGKTGEYLSLLANAFNPAAAAGLMCRDTVSVAWDGRVYDCDFNQQLAMALMIGGGGDEGEEEGDGGRASAAGAGSHPRRPLTVFDIEDLSELEGRHVATDAHCYGCTAGQGSGCQGATAAG